MSPILVNLLLILAFVVVGYLIGGIPTGVIIGKVFYHKDPRDYGSHNSGGTNAGRVLGKKAGYAVIALDMLKSVLLFWIGTVIVVATGLASNPDIWLRGILLPWCAVVMCAIGHCYSIYLKGQGGKAVSCYLGAAAFTSWLNFIVCVLVFFPMFLPKKVMSISTIVTGAFVTLTHWVVAILIRFVPASIGFFSIASWSFGGFPASFFFGWVPAISCTIIYALLVLRHSSNIKRLLAGEEKGVSWSGKVDN